MRKAKEIKTPRALVVPTWVQLVGLPLVLVASWMFLDAAGHAASLFLIATMISLLLNPLVRVISKTKVPRIVAVFIVFGTFSTLVTFVTIGLVNAAVPQTERIQDNLPQYIEQAEGQLDSTQKFLDKRNIDVNLRERGTEFLNELEQSSLRASTDVLRFGRTFLEAAAHALFNVILVVVIAIYMLLDAPRIGRFISQWFHPDSQIDALFYRMERGLVNYVRGQTMVCLAMGASATAGLWILGETGVWEQGQELAVVFGIIVAFTELIPYLGPILGAIPPTLIATFDDPLTGIFIALFFLGLHQIEGHVVIPKLMGNAVGVHPLVIIFGMLAGAQIWGFGGVFIVLPALAVGREIVVFMRERLVFQGWTAVAMPVSGPASDATERAAEAVSHRQRDAASAVSKASTADAAKDTKTKGGLSRKIRRRKQ